MLDRARACLPRTLLGGWPLLERSRADDRCQAINPVPMMVPQIEATIVHISHWSSFLGEYRSACMKMY